jgi:glycosyltransferase involved in cell wall biosynthesis
MSMLETAAPKEKTTVLMATHNGAQTLPIVLRAYCDLQPLSSKWKLVIVDNGSTDSTREIIESFRAGLPITYIREPRIGKNIALNTGLENISGDLVLLTDDDAVPRPNWLVETRRVAEAQPSFSVFGGVVVPQWEVPPEPWILEHVTYKYAVTDPAWEEGPILPIWVYGPNMAIRSEVFAAGHRFDIELGPRGSNYQQGDETEFLQRIGRSGFQCWHCKAMVVAHIIRKHQMTKQWLLRRAIPIGRAQFRREFEEKDLPPALFGMPRYLIRKIMRQGFQVGCAALSGNSDRVLTERFTLNCLIGRAMASRTMYQQRNEVRSLEGALAKDSKSTR